LNPQELAALPPALRKRFDPRRYRYAVVGLKDDTSGDLIPPGSLVEVDVMQNACRHLTGESMRERPVYLVWHNDGNSCSLNDRCCVLTKRPCSMSTASRVDSLIHDDPPHRLSQKLAHFSTRHQVPLGDYGLDDTGYHRN